MASKGSNAASSSAPKHSSKRPRAPPTISADDIRPSSDDTFDQAEFDRHLGHHYDKVDKGVERAGAGAGGGKALGTQYRRKDLVRDLFDPDELVPKNGGFGGGHDDFTGVGGWGMCFGGIEVVDASKYLVVKEKRHGTDGNNGKKDKADDGDAAADEDKKKGKKKNKDKNRLKESLASASASAAAVDPLSNKSRALKSTGADVKASVSNKGSGGASASQNSAVGFGEAYDKTTSTTTAAKNTKKGGTKGGGSKTLPPPQESDTDSDDFSDEEFDIYVLDTSERKGPDGKVVKVQEERNVMSRSAWAESDDDDDEEDEDDDDDNNDDDEDDDGNDEEEEVPQPLSKKTSSQSSAVVPKPISSSTTTIITLSSLSSKLPSPPTPDGWAIISGALPPLLRHNLSALGYAAPTAIQSATLPAALLSGRDVVGAAPTGSGKTMAYGIPIMTYILKERERNVMFASCPAGRPPPCPKLVALVMCPTRELALQVGIALSSLVVVPDKYGGGKAVAVSVIVGGLAGQKQMRVLKNGPGVVVATPGRLWEMVSVERDVRVCVVPLY